MSYSRWSNSLWYTYWSSTSSNTINDQVFEICGVTSFTYKEIIDDIEKCLDRACELQKRVYDTPFGGPFDPLNIDKLSETKYKINESLAPTSEEREELKGYMIKFTDHVNSDKDIK